MSVEYSVLLIPDKAKLSAAYAASKPMYEKALSDAVSKVSATLAKTGLQPIIKSRVKEFESYYSKKMRFLKAAWTDKCDPPPINDILAVRIVCPFLSDLAVAEKALSESFNIVEIERKGAEHSFREFGYESIHVLISVPKELMPLCAGLERKVIEIQLRTILQEAWAEVEHELVYKAEYTPFDEPMRRKLAALNANLTLSDIIFQEILEYQKRLNSELGNRRERFYRMMEEAAEAEDGTPADAAEPGKEAPGLAESRGGEVAPGVTSGSAQAQDYSSYGSLGLDGLLLAALEAHNKSDFPRAIDLYSRIIEENPGKEVVSVVYKHRGMAYFVQSMYKEAMDDFSSCIDLDPSCYKALYFRGVVKAIFGHYGEAVEDFGRALDIHPYHFFSRYRRALCYWKMGDTIQALSDCEIALRIEPENALARRLAGQIRDRIVEGDF